MTQTLAETGDQGEKAKEGPPVSTPQIRQMVSIKLLATVMGGNRNQLSGTIAGFPSC